jgi:hypothetical protein
MYDMATYAMNVTIKQYTPEAHMCLEADNITCSIPRAREIIIALIQKGARVQLNSTLYGSLKLDTSYAGRYTVHDDMTMPVIAVICGRYTEDEDDIEPIVELDEE